MSNRNSFLLRIDPEILEAIRVWADDDMRSMNGQIEYLLREQLKKSGRLRNKTKIDPANSEKTTGKTQDMNTTQDE